MRLGDMSEVISKGTTPTTLGYAFTTSGVPFLRAEDINGGVVDVTQVAYHISNETHEILSRSQLLSGDLLITIAGTLGRVGYVPNDSPPLNCNQAVAFARLNPKIVDVEYACFACQSQQVLRSLTDLRAGGIIQNLNLQQVQSFLIPLPPLPEQKRIAAILNEQMAAVERARDAAEAQLNAAKDLPAAYLREVFESPKAEQWRKKRIDEFAQTYSGSTPSRTRADYYIGVIPWVKTGELRDGFISDTEEHVSETALRECSIKILPADTLLIAMYGQGQTRGRTGLLTKPATTNQACFAILPNPDEFDSQYLQLWFRHNYSRLRRETEGRGGNQPNLNGEVLNRQQAPLPPLGEQRDIVKTVTERLIATERVRKRLQDQLDSINKLPAALLRQAFTGKL
jgi:type I restriction enzyme S subunit